MTISDKTTHVAKLHIATVRKEFFFQKFLKLHGQENDGNSLKKAMSDSDSTSDNNSNPDIYLAERTCCAESHYLCVLLPLCVHEIRFIYRELKRPARDQELSEGNIVLIDKELNFTSRNLYGLVVKVTPKTVTLFTNGKNYEKRLKKNVQKLRATTITEKWQENLHLEYTGSIYSIE